MIFHRIVKLCNARGISIGQLEQETGLANATIRRWITHSPSVFNLKKVADYFGVPVDYFLTDPEGGENE